jgi:transposase
MNRVRGWAEIGHRLVDRVVAGHWETNTLVHAIALDGTRAAMILDGPVDGISFAGFCEHFLAPTLQPGDLVVLDNLSSHKSTAAAQSIEAVGARLVFLPPYSPDLNPIENIFSKLKQLVRGFRPKTWKQIIEAAKQGLQQISLDEICNAIAHAGYVAT